MCVRTSVWGETGLPCGRPTSEIAFALRPYPPSRFYRRRMGIARWAVRRRSGRPTPRTAPPSGRRQPEGGGCEMAATAQIQEGIPPFILLNTPNLTNRGGCACTALSVWKRRRAASGIWSCAALGLIEPSGILACDETFAPQQLRCQAAIWRY